LFKTEKLAAPLFDHAPHLVIVYQKLHSSTRFMK